MTEMSLKNCHIGVQDQIQMKDPLQCDLIMSDEQAHKNYHYQTDQSTLMVKISDESIFEKENEIVHLIKSHPNIKKLNIVLSKGTITIVQAKLIGEKLKQIKSLVEVNILFH
ncbi:hypothetical protein ABPG74_017449 [Tetrahymena malaccensis]